MPNFNLPNPGRIHNPHDKNEPPKITWITILCGVAFGALLIVILAKFG